MRVLLIVVLQLVCCALFAQEDSVLYTRDLKLKEGIYRSFNDFKNNTPIPKESITNTNRGIHAPDFFVQLFNKNSVTYKDSSGTEQKLDINDVWGYCHEQSIFIGSRDAVRLPVVGSLCHFTRVETVYGPNMYGGVAGPVYSPPRQEINQYMLDMRTGNRIYFSVSNFEALLEKYDQQLYNEFVALKKRKKKDMKFVYLRKFNEKHPLYFPVN